MKRSKSTLNSLMTQPFCPSENFHSSNILVRPTRLLGDSGVMRASTLAAASGGCMAALYFTAKLLPPSMPAWLAFRSK